MFLWVEEMKSIECVISRQRTFRILSCKRPTWGGEGEDLQMWDKPILSLYWASIYKHTWWNCRLGAQGANESGNSKSEDILNLNADNHRQWNTLAVTVRWLILHQLSLNSVRHTMLRQEIVPADRKERLNSRKSAARQPGQFAYSLLCQDRSCLQCCHQFSASCSTFYMVWSHECWWTRPPHHRR